MILLGRFFQKTKPTEEPDIENSITDESYLLDSFSPDSIEEGANYLRLGGNYVRTLAVSHFSNQVEAGFLEKLHTMSSNVSVIHHIEPTPSHEMIKALNRAVIEYKSRLQEPRLRPVDQIKLENDLQDAEILLQNLVDGSSEMFVEHMLVHIQADSLDKLNSITHQVKTQMSRSIKLLTPYFRMLEAFQSVLPVRSHKIPEMTYRNFDSESISSLFPFDECEIVSEKGIIKGKNLKTNSIVLVDHDELLNRNEVVIATSGGGKSTYLFGDIMRRWMQGTTIRIVDPKGEFGEKARKLGGEWIKISPMNDNVINPFEIMNATIATDESGQPLEASLLHQKISRLKTMFTLMYKDLKEQQVAMALLEKVLVEVYQDKGITWDTNFKSKQSSDYPIIRDLYEKIELLMHTEEQYTPLAGFYQVLYPYVEGSYSKAFNGVTNVDLSNDLIVFDLFDLRNEGDLQQVAMYNILTFLWDDVTMDKTKIHQIFVDEAHILSDPKNPLAMEFLASMYKLIRSFSGGVTSATQQVGDFLSAVEGSRNYGEAVILNSVTKLYLPMVQEEMNSIRERTSESFSEEEQRLLVIQDADKHQNAGKGIYVVGSKKVHLQVELTPSELKLWDAAWYQRKYGGR
jgi:type IV secretory pathway VirB4 component